LAKVSSLCETGLTGAPLSGSGPYLGVDQLGNLKADIKTVVLLGEERDEVMGTSTMNRNVIRK
jgi:hypothetical protein